jgi:hypothetical protein
VLIITDTQRKRGGEVEGVSVMKDQVVKFEEIETSQTLGGTDKTFKMTHYVVNLFIMK